MRNGQLVGFPVAEPDRRDNAPSKLTRKPDNFPLTFLHAALSYHPGNNCQALATCKKKPERFTSCPATSYNVSRGMATFSLIERQ